MAIRRRQFLAISAGLIATPALLEVNPAAAQPGSAAPALPPEYPAQDPNLSRDMVGASHGNVARVREILAVSPTYGKASWDWGFGDWETAIGAASHVGNREIVDLLVTNGARPDLFTFAMLGNLDAVRAMLTARPELAGLHGPHGLTLMHHARQGGEAAAAVVAWLESRGDADPVYRNDPLAEADRDRLVGVYAFGATDAERFDVAVTKTGGLAIKRLPGGSARNLFHQGGSTFHPPGNSSIRIAFEPESGAVQRLVLREGAGSVVATRVTT